ncbi:MAG: polysaccharide biosynthesis C-terminal domain-containing protein, partial [Ignavibacteria bacterium]
MPEDYGILDLLGTITLVSSFLIVSGTDSALGYYYYRKEYNSERPIMISSLLWLRLFFSLAALAVIFFGSSFLSNLIFGRNYSLFIIITGFTIVFSSIYSFLFDLLRLEFRTWLYTFVSTGGILLHILLTIYYVLILKQGVYGALMAGCIAYGFFFIVTVLYVFRRYGFGFSNKWSKNILKYGFPLIGTGIAIWVLSSTDRYFLAHYVDLSSVGIYSVGMKLAAFLGLISGALQLAWGPFAMDIQYQDNARQVYSKVFLIFFYVTITGVFLISMFSIDILKVFTQPDYYSAKIVVPFLCLSTILSSGYFIVVVGIHLTKKLQHTIWITLAAASVNIILNFVLTPVYGVIGAAFSIMTANFIIFLLTLIISQKHYQIPYKYKKVLTLFIPSLLIVAASYYFNLRLVLRIIISSLFLFFTVIVLYKDFRESYEFKNMLEKLSLKSGKLKLGKWR